MGIDSDVVHQIFFIANRQELVFPSIVDMAAYLEGGAMDGIFEKLGFEFVEILKGIMGHEGGIGADIDNHVTGDGFYSVVLVVVSG